LLPIPLFAKRSQLLRMRDASSLAKLDSLQAHVTQECPRCRNIRTLFNFEPPATEDEIHASALQFVHKLSGFTRPSKANEAAFQRAVEEVSDAVRWLLDALEKGEPTAKSRSRSDESEQPRPRERFA
jgi:hypothetical protein